MAHTETTLNSQTIFSGRIIEVKKDDIQLENGKKSIREVVVHHGGVCVAAIDQEDRLLLVRQFRYPYGKELLELPAGKSSWAKTRANVAFGNYRRNVAVLPTALKN